MPASEHDRSCQQRSRRQQPGNLRLEAFLVARGISCALVERVSGAPTALGASYGGRIEIRGDLSPAEALTTLLHEAAHELLHQDRAVVRPPHVVRELEADAVACVVAEALGLRAIAATADYVHLHQGSAELLALSLGRIRRVAGELLGALDERPPAPSEVGGAVPCADCTNSGSGEAVLAAT